MLPIGETRIFGRGDRIWTCGLCVPNAALYQTEPHLDIQFFVPKVSRKFRICGIICGRSGIYRYFLYTVPPIKWLFIRSCRSSADFTLTVRYGIPNQALYQTEPHPVNPIYFITNIIFCQYRFSSFLLCVFWRLKCFQKSFFAVFSVFLMQNKYFLKNIHFSIAFSLSM